MRYFLRFAVLCLAAYAAAPAASRDTALDRYIAQPDAHYKYELINTIQGDGFTAYVLEMTSQSWRSSSEVDRTVWKHWVTIIKPATVKSTTGFLLIAGGSNLSKPPAAVDPMLSQIAIDTQSVVTQLSMVPNQPLTFAGETKGRVEDSFIAYTWDKFLRGGDDMWPARLPMTKSAVRAMDTVTAFCGTEQAGKIKVDHFIVAGASKRGWTTWTTAAVDKRVVAIMPMVIDMLNIEPSFQHHWQAYGFWAPAVGDYSRMRIIDWSGTPQYRALMKIEEPYEYRDRLTMPKFMINASGDQFFLPDSAQFYWSDLKGEKYIRYVPNTDHSLRNSDAKESLEAYYTAVLNGRPRPKVSWKFEKEGSIQVKTDGKPVAVKLWQATNPDARDFRLEKIGPVWKESELTENGKGTYVAKVDKPAKGWTAFFVELTLPSGGQYPFKFTSGVRVSPDVLPFPPPLAKRPVIQAE